MDSGISRNLNHFLDLFEFFVRHGWSLGGEPPPQQPGAECGFGAQSLAPAFAPPWARGLPSFCPTVLMPAPSQVHVVNTGKLQGAVSQRASAVLTFVRVFVLKSSVDFDTSQCRGRSRPLPSPPVPLGPTGSMIVFGKVEGCESHHHLGTTGEGVGWAFRASSVPSPEIPSGTLESPSHTHLHFLSNSCQKTRRGG